MKVRRVISAADSIKSVMGQAPLAAEVPHQPWLLGDTLGSRAPVLVGCGICEAGEASCVDPRMSKWENRYRIPGIAVVTSGVFNYRSPSGSTTAVPGTVLFANAGEDFSCEHLDTAGNRRLYVALDPEFVEEVANDCCVESASFVGPTLSPSAAATVFYGMVGKVTNGGIDNEEAIIGLTATALRLHRHHQAPPISLSQRARVIEVVRHLEDAYTNPCSLSELSGQAGLSRYHFIRVFREVTGASPRQYLMYARMRAATDRLLDLTEPVTTIALAVGFNDISHFNSVFRKTFGVSPRQWRKTASPVGQKPSTPPASGPRCC
jgi:AraC family transcriptional regulator